MSHRSLLGALVGAIMLCGCATDSEPTQAPTVETIAIEAALVDDVLVAGGSLGFEVSGAGVLVPLRAKVLAEGSVDGTPMSEERSLEAELETSDLGGLRVSVPWEVLVAGLGLNADSRFEGRLTLVIEDLGKLLEGVDVLDDVTVQVVAGLTPSLEVPPTLEVFVNERRVVGAEGMLRHGEGTSAVNIVGTFLTDGGTLRNVDEMVTVGDGESRQSATLWFPAWLFGVEPGQFSGTIKPVNTHAVGPSIESEAAEVSVTVLASEIDLFSPAVASRGQIVTIVGRGFAEPDAERGVSTFFRFDGNFVTQGGTSVPMSGDSALQLAPESVPAHTEAILALRSEIQEVGDKLQLIGLTARPGTFTGAITPVLIEGATVAYGAPTQGSFTIGATRQEVYCKFLPAYTDALETFGLRNVEPEIRARIFEVLARDYKEFNVGFDDERPADFVEYSVIEVSGPDPNNAGLFGLDNSAGKDTGNIRLNDIVGSENAASGEQGFYSFGGVFVESFTAFSAQLDPSSQVASAEFDAIFGPFMPALGGTPISGTEVLSGDRTEAIDAAVRAMGSLIGNTLSHEIGHSLGLAFFQEDLFTSSGRFHNELDSEGAIMDSGKFRPFAERAELEGTAEPYFVQRNRNYLQDILPLE